ncbi:phage/plasmid primase, P4 family [Bradyrhizobium sp. 63_E2_N1_3]|uniref:phage/plasmid primase, P4 family n=1 Tax=Bradyrhizobium sp. 63_E2_N1_3 TaxID=3240373 RepID=UPI003F8B4D96
MSAQPKFNEEAQTFSGNNAHANDNAQTSDNKILLDYKRDHGGTLSRHNGVVTLIGCRVGDDVGNATVHDGAAVFAPTEQPIAVVDGAVIHLSESDLAAVLVRRNQLALRYDCDRGKWFKWSGAHWLETKPGAVLHEARILAHTASTGKKTKELIAARKASFIRGIETLAQKEPPMPTSISEWDADDYLLGTPGGTVDLRTGALRPADQDDMITKLTAVAPADNEDCPRWIAFLNEATSGDSELIGFLKRWFGYCLTGDTREHALVFVFGPSGTGKSRFIAIMEYVLNNYATTAGMEVFTASKFDRHTTELARLAGARLVTASETEEGKAWDEARVKQLTGGDRIAARFMRQDNFEFVPRFKLSIVGNHMPRVKRVSDAMQRRLNVVPFSIKPAVVDQDLPAKLEAEAAGILRWAINGCLDWQRVGLGRPSKVKDANADYFESQDTISQWLEECCRVEKDNKYLKATRSDLFTSWKNYAEAANEYAGKQSDLFEHLRREGFREYRVALGRGFSGLQIKNEHPARYEGE